MATAETTLVINRPIQDVFAIVSNLENDPKYSSQVVEAEITSPGPLGVGSTGRLVTKYMGRRVENTGEITEFVPNRRYAWRFTSSPVPLGGWFTFQPAGDGTRVAAGISASPTGALKLAAPLIAKMGRRWLAHDLGTLKRLMETNAL